MAFSIHPVEEKDLDSIATLNTASKMALSINRLLWKNWPNEKQQHATCLGAVENSFKDSTQRQIKAVDNESGDLVGFVCFTQKKGTPPQPDAAVTEPTSNDDNPQELPAHFNPDVLNTVMNSVHEIAKETEHLDRVELIFMVVKLGYREKGVGTQLVNVLLEQARAEKIPVVIQAEPAAYGFFKKLGFQDTKHAEWDLSKWAVPRSGFGLFALSGMIWHP